MIKKIAEKTEISVIIPAYNEGKFLDKCLDAALNQTLSVPYEIIVVNNNSTDNTKEVALKKGVKVVEEYTQGIAFSRNAGAKVACGKVLFFLDADCLIPSDHLQKVNDIFRQNPDVALVGGPYAYYDAPIFMRFIINKLNIFKQNFLKMWLF